MKTNKLNPEKLTAWLNENLINRGFDELYKGAQIEFLTRLDESVTRPIKPRLRSEAASDEVLQYAELLKVYEVESKDYLAYREAYRVLHKELNETFDKWLRAYIGLDQYTEEVSRMIWSKAWEYGHSCGYRDVVLYAEELADFTDKVIKSVK